MKNLIKFFICCFIFYSVPVLSLSADTVKSLKFSAKTRTEKVVINMDAKQKLVEYLTPSRNYSYTILDYDYKANTDDYGYIFKGTLVDTMRNTATEIRIYSNGSFTDMRIGNRQVVFNHIEEFEVE
ncbi:hypothetical protein [Treponema sp.]|uniref:hypothetical protein n=1 Tax=Treponema sp. TaxID=166 RepID=UPI00388D00B6